MTTVLWFRRDLRVHDHPALAAAAGGGPVLPLFVLDPAIVAGAGRNRLAYLSRSLHGLDASLGGSLVVRTGRPADVVAAVAAEVRAEAVHVSADTTPLARRRDREVAERVDLVATGSPYAVTPGRLRTGAGTGYQVFTPFFRAWADHGWRSPAESLAVDWVTAPSEPLPDHHTTAALPEAGEEAARERWRAFLDDGLADYPHERDRPDHRGTSHLSTALRFGELHPRTLLADLAGRDDEPAVAFRRQLAWREFHADVLWHHPRATTWPLKEAFTRMEYDAPGPLFEAWCEGRTGFPLVDAGMRELLATGWMHNRVRMVTASFLVKDLHVHWTHGARHFAEHLVDFDVAQNQLNWQWVAGCGADAAPYFRIFNPSTQAATHDPDGSYVNRWIPELGTAAYPAPVVDHATQRREALARLGRMSA